MCATNAIAFLRRSCIRWISISRTCSSRCALVSASSSRMSQLAPGCSNTSWDTASITANGGIAEGSSTASFTRCAAEDLERVVMTSSNSSARPPVSRRTVWLLTPAALATMWIRVPANPYLANNSAAASIIRARTLSSETIGTPH